VGCLASRYGGLACLDFHNVDGVVIAEKFAVNALRKEVQIFLDFFFEVFVVCLLFFVHLTKKIDLVIEIGMHLCNLFAHLDEAILRQLQTRSQRMKCPFRVFREVVL